MCVNYPLDPGTVLCTLVCVISNNLTTGCGGKGAITRLILPRVKRPERLDKGCSY